MVLKQMFSCLVAVFVLAIFVSPTASNAADMRAAKKEGKVVWYTSLILEVSQNICNNFTKKNPGIKCVLHRSGAGAVYRRYLREAKSKLFLADVFHSANIGHFGKLKKKFLIPYLPKGADKIDSKFRTKDNSWTVMRIHVIGPAYNTKKVKASEVPKSWKDFLHPRWKGRIVHSNPNYSSGTTVNVIALSNILGWNFYEKLAALKPKIIKSAGGITTVLARGEAHLTLTGASFSLYNAIQRGEPIKMIYPKEGVPLVFSPTAALKKAPHPNAARVFIDYLFSLEAQQEMVDKGLWVVHPGVKYPPDLLPLNKLKKLITPAQEVKEKTKGVRKKFRKIFGV